MRSIGFVALASFVACAANDPTPSTGVAREAVTSGSADASDAAVVALVDSDGGLVCTGTLISPHVVLTAAHCAISETTYTRYRAYFGDAPASGDGAFVAISAAHTHPAFDSSSLANDLALLVLAADVSAAPIPVLAPTSDAALAGATIRVVGFGRAGDAGSGTKRSGSASVASVSPTTFDLAPSPSLPCEGDSGGPGILTVNGAEYLAGVTSHGDGACATTATDARVDAYATTFIQPYLDSIAEGSAPPGARCLYPEQCAASACVVATDDASLQYCAPPCGPSDACPARMTCENARCLYALPTPGALGSACKDAADCVGGDCLATGVCGVRCVSGASACPSGFACENTGGIDFYCVATPAPPPSSSSSCAAVPEKRAAPSTALACVFFALTLALRRRRS